MKTLVINDYTLTRGENAQENWDMIDIAGPGWVWFHLNSFSSSHVIIKSDSPEDYAITAASEWCKDSSKYKRVPNIKICYTKISNLQRGAKPGSVTFRSKKKVNYIKI